MLYARSAISKTRPDQCSEYEIQGQTELNYENGDCVRLIFLKRIGIDRVRTGLKNLQVLYSKTGPKCTIQIVLN